MIVNEEPQKLECNVSTEILWLLEYKMSLSIFSQIPTISHFLNNCKIEIIAVLQGKEKYV